MADEPATTANDFQMNRPTIISLLYIGSFLAGVTALIGIVLALVWRNEPHEPWEDSHYRYHVRTFWMGIVWTILAVIGSVISLGLLAWLLLPLVAVWFAVRAIKSLLAAQKQQPLTNVETWLV